MEQKLIKSGSMRMGNTRYKTNFFRTMKLDELVGYSFEVIFDTYDKIIIDDNDRKELVKKIRYIVPIAHHSRLVAKMNMNIDPAMDMDMNRNIHMITNTSTNTSTNTNMNMNME
jgi:hypothetical protein